MPAVLDQFNRSLGTLRVSVTDRCNLRCNYCMPEEDYVWLERDKLLSFEELAKLVRIFSTLGASKVRLTGGEPLLRRNLPELVRMLRTNSNITDLALTTNGVLLGEHAAALKNAGLSRVTISLDTLRPERFQALTRRDDLQRVAAGIDTANRVGFAELKLNTVVMRGVNDDEAADILAFARENNAEARFIEYMDVGGATRWKSGAVVSRQEILARLEKRFGKIEPLFDQRGAAPAERYVLPDGTIFGVIASVTAPFCGDCDRSRLTADGVWLLCLYATEGVNLLTLLRENVAENEIVERIRQTWQNRTDRGAEARRQLDAAGIRSPLYQIGELRRHPHREMHTRGG